MYVIANLDISHLDKLLLDENGVLKPLPANDLRNIPTQELKVWAVKNAVYQFPTTELIEFLGNEIGDRSAIEICAGHGGIGKALNIPSTDSFMQQLPEVQQFYAALKAPTTNPPAHVLKYEATEAVDYFKPQVVVGAYVTQLYKEGDTESGIGSNIYGVNEEYIVEKVETYIMIGNLMSHQDKRVFSSPYKEYQFPWLINRSRRQNLNRIWIWNK